MRKLRTSDPPGTPVSVLLDDGSRWDTKTRSEIWLLGHGKEVVLLEGQTDGYSVDRCTVGNGANHIQEIQQGEIVVDGAPWWTGVTIVNSDGREIVARARCVSTVLRYPTEEECNRDNVGRYAASMSYSGNAVTYQVDLTLGDLNALGLTGQVTDWGH